MSKEIYLTGDRPTGKLHIGHYIGSLKNRVIMQDSGAYDPFVMIADTQAFTDNARNPEKIGSRVYANRMGNGDEKSGDGYKFRGRGYLQITGKENYREFGKVIEVDLVNNPDLIATNYPLLSAAWFFKTRGLITMSDKGPGVDVITSITLRVNGGKNGLDDRIQRFNKIYQAIK